MWECLKYYVLIVFHSGREYKGRLEINIKTNRSSHSSHFRPDSYLSIHRRINEQKNTYSCVGHYQLQFFPTYRLGEGHAVADVLLRYATNRSTERTAPSVPTHEVSAKTSPRNVWVKGTWWQRTYRITRKITHTRLKGMIFFSEQSFASDTSGHKQRKS